METVDTAEFRRTTTEAFGPQLAQIRKIAIGMAGAGLLLAAIGLLMNGPTRFFHSYLFAFMFWMGVTGGSLGLLMLHHTVGGGWGFVIRRFLESASSIRMWLLVLAFFIPIVIGLLSFHLYEWAHPKPGDVVVAAKQPYLNVPFFIVRALIYFAIWMFFAWKIHGLGRTQYERTDQGVFDRLNFWGALGILVYVLFMTFASVDWVLSLTPHWTSSIFGLLTVASQALSTMALMIVLIAHVGGETRILRIVPSGMFRDLGNLTLAMVMLWAYLAFSQYLITFSGNQLEEITWYLQRTRGGWTVVPVLLVLFHFALPFLALLTGSNLKRSPRKLAGIAFVIIAARLVDLFWLVVPAYGHGAPINISAADFGMPLLLGGIWLLVWEMETRDKPLVATHDPRFIELVHAAGHHHAEGDHTSEAVAHG